jgi:hypothetical protein
MKARTKRKEILIAEILMCFSKDGSWQTNPRFRWMEDICVTMFVSWKTLELIVQRGSISLSHQPPSNPNIRGDINSS